MNIFDWRARRKNLPTTLPLFLVILTAIVSVSCNYFNPKIVDKKAPVLLSPVEEADKEKLFAEINRLAEVKSIFGKVDVKFEDNTFAESGIAEKYKSADGQVIVQAPANINLKIQIPFVGTDIVQMTSDGEKFRVAVICCVEERFKRFVVGTNDADYSALQRKAREVVGRGDAEKRAISAFSTLRPQHFTDALLMRPVETGADFAYALSEIYQDEANAGGKTATGRVIRGYYLLDELKKNGDSFNVSRRFWFDRVGGIRLARQQVFGDSGELISDIAYGAEQKFGETGAASMPVQVQVTRPQERYSVRITYQTPNAVNMGQTFETPVFQLENKWNLPEVDLDKQLQQLQTNANSQVFP